MYLNRIYSEPLGLFKAVEFKNGLNFIHGIKDDDTPKESLNSIGKSTFLDLIDFTLLSSFTKTHNQRLYKAREIMSGYNIVLEFEVNKTTYIVKRNVDDPNNIEFGALDDNTSIYPIKELKRIFGNLIFKRNQYKGVFLPSKWFRKLALFYIKIQKFKKAKFLDPIKYMSEISETEINISQFYLLGLNNSITNKIFEHRVLQSGISTTIKEVSKYVTEKYDITDLKQAQIETSRLKLEIKKLSDSIDKFELGAQYDDAEKEANILTEKIKNNLYQNFVDNEKLKSYQSSFSLPSKVNMRRINTMYKEISEDFALKVSKTLKEAIDFRKKLNASRKEFLQSEIEKIKENIEKRNKTIAEGEKARAKIFTFLATKEAITDLTEAFNNLNEKRNKLGDIESNTKILFDLQKELDEILTELRIISNESMKFLNIENDRILKFSENFDSVYNSIYLNKNDTSQLSIIGGSNKKSILEIDISLPDMFGKGKNQGRTLIYDLSVLLFNIINTNNFPNFLIHDGIFDGVDKAHFISVCKFIERITTTDNKIQYITTINEEGTLSNKFGDKEIVSPEYIEQNSILTLSPTDKLFNVDF
ncbi:DUF2326 domain-containing protein [Tenacibaculum maritimum]|uniref:DUF2326 domain-containing protein n=1 Tax=Tenacibaculum maritimum TaxID=107401 RepID=UPI0012E5C8FC|nr:DUF2326 domain-containing protein [Tenacibaculum maritimum]CAA0152919.1 conserved hypothetical protein [Tenacibaculum maritimum]